MDDLPVDLKAFLANHPFLQLTDSKKVSRLTALTSTRDASRVATFC